MTEVEEDNKKTLKTNSRLNNFKKIRRRYTLMRVQDMQQFLTSFTEGSDAVKNAVIFAEVNGTLYDMRRMEVHENASSHRWFQRSYSAQISFKN